MSNVRVKYIGTAGRFSEVSITGQQQVWQKGEAGFVSDTNAALLVASGLFALAEVQRAQLVPDTSGGAAGILDPKTGNVLPLGGGGNLSVTGNQVVGGVLTGAYAQGSGTFIFTRTPIAGGATVDIGTAVASGSTYTVQAADRGCIIAARPVSYLPPNAAGLSIPTVAPLAPTITGITAGDGAVTVTFTRNSDTGGDTVVGDRVNVYNAVTNALLAMANGTSPITVNGLTNGVAVYAKAATIGQLNGVGPLSAPSSNVTPAASVTPAYLYSTASVMAGTSTTNGFMSQISTKDSNRVETVIRNQTRFTLVTAESTSDNLTINQPASGTYVDLPPNSENVIAGNGAKMWLGAKAITPSSVTSSGTVCTIVFSSAHNMINGDIVSLIDFVPAGYNGQLYAVTVVDATTITVNLAATAAAVTTMGKLFPRPITGVTIETKTTP